MTHRLVQDLKVGMYVTCNEQPLYWDASDNDENPEDYSDDELVEYEEHPGFNDDMYQMLNQRFEIVEVHDRKPWVRIYDDNGSSWWWHIDWLSIPRTQVVLSEIDKNSKYLKVITKIKKMQARRTDLGYKF